MNKPIYIFYHICLMKAWKPIVEEQLRLIEESGLYDACEKIHIGCCGDLINKQQLELMIKDKGKIKIYAYSPDIKAYEFITLKLIHDFATKATQEVYCMYIHDKTVSYSDRLNNVGKYWLDYLNYYTITEWRKSVKFLNEGYETVGTQIRTTRDTPARRFHYSGNFFVAKSSYLKLLPAIETLDKYNRWAAEFWMSAYPPIAATLCQEWCDYNSDSKGEFRLRGLVEGGYEWGDNSKKSGKNYSFTLGFNTVSEITKATEKLHSQNKVGTFEHTIIDLNFPLEDGDIIPDDIEKAKENNSIKLKLLAAQYGYKYEKKKNEGCSPNWTTMVKQINPTDNDIVVGCDCDEVVLNDNWIEAMGKVLRSHEKIALTCLIQPEQSDIINTLEHEEKIIDGVRCYVFDGLVSWALIGLSGKFLNLIGNTIPTPTSAIKYGYIEHALHPLMKKNGWRWAFLADHKAIHTNNGKLYRQWKDDIIFGKYKNNQIDFEDWIKLKKSSNT